MSNNFHWTKSRSILKRVYQLLVCRRSLTVISVSLNETEHSHYEMTIDTDKETFMLWLSPSFQFINCRVFDKSSNLFVHYTGLGDKHSIVHSIYNYLIKNISDIPGMTNFQKHYFCHYYNNPCLVLD